jgi:hypothetical protein
VARANGHRFRPRQPSPEGPSCAAGENRHAAGDAINASLRTGMIAAAMTQIQKHDAD